MSTHESSTEVPAIGGADRLVRAPEAARWLGLSPATLAKLRCTGGGPQYVKLGRAVAYEISDLRAWRESQGKHASTASQTRASLAAGSRTEGSDD
jgi:predicted DNA-binding transcriptional regulator AlpA